MITSPNAPDSPLEQDEYAQLHNQWNTMNNTLYPHRHRHNMDLDPSSSSSSSSSSVTDVEREVAPHSIADRPEVDLKAGRKVLDGMKGGLEQRKQWIENTNNREQFLAVMEHIRDEKLLIGAVGLAKTASEQVIRLGLQRDLGAYQGIIDILPKNSALLQTRSLFDAIWPQGSEGVEFGMDLMCVMESHSVRPDRRFFARVWEVYGRASEPVKKCIAMHYWMGYFRKRNPYRGSTLRADGSPYASDPEMDKENGDSGFPGGVGGSTDTQGRKTSKNINTSLTKGSEQNGYATTTPLSRSHIAALGMLRMFGHLGCAVVPYHQHRVPHGEASPDDEDLSGESTHGESLENGKDEEARPGAGEGASYDRRGDGFILGCFLDREIPFVKEQVVHSPSNSKKQVRAYVSGPSCVWLGAVSLKYYTLTLRGRVIAACALDEHVYRDEEELDANCNNSRSNNNTGSDMMGSKQGDESGTNGQGIEGREGAPELSTVGLGLRTWTKRLAEEHPQLGMVDIVFRTVRPTSNSSSSQTASEAKDATLTTALGSMNDPLSYMRRSDDKMTMKSTKTKKKSDSFGNRENPFF
eukprot:Nk52_evm1s359 gene=Nk52_evmTU1s359